MCFESIVSSNILNPWSRQVSDVVASLAWPSGGILVKHESLQGFIQDSNRWMVFSSLRTEKDGKGNGVPSGPCHPCHPKPQSSPILLS